MYIHSIALICKLAIRFVHRKICKEGGGEGLVAVLVKGGKLLAVLGGLAGGVDVSFDFDVV